ncbi:hypothetical protein C8A03DRAFT_46987 [Achaetomium macrosporum]|uniref:Uncharacterized protein n=1 Tax=Achaetomium macrosporum TaxID=79813 RepID=A0AAN7C3K2_9PEZI|nr:hypothetical protein C8A03DRAFT_46987 [Achaetomium macrosporum]
MTVGAGRPGSTSLSPIADTPFIITTSLAKPDPKTRRLIRSHVMRGKNVVISGNIASGLSLYVFGKEGGKPYVVELIYRALTIVKPATEALQDITIDTPQDNLFCFTNLTDHPGILHSMVFAAQAFHDVACGHSYGPLDNPKAVVELTTIAIVSSLAIAAVITRDLATASKHMDGLRMIVELRGGLQSLGPGSLIAHKARVIDLGLAMGLGTDLRFFRDEDISWSPQIARSRTATRFRQLRQAVQGHPQPDPRLLNVWADLCEFSKLVNEATARGAKVTSELSSCLATSVLHRLLRLRCSSDEAPASLHELLRLCMLTYAKILFVKLCGLGRKMTAFAGGLETVLSAWHSSLRASGAKGQMGLLELVLCASVVASVSIFEDAKTKWLAEMLQQNGGAQAAPVDRCGV